MKLSDDFGEPCAPQAVLSPTAAQGSPKVCEMLSRLARVWTDEEKTRLRELVDAGLSDKEIGLELDRSPSSIKKKRILKGVLRDPQRRLLIPEGFAEIANAYPNDELGKKFGVSPGIITRWRREAGVGAFSHNRIPIPEDFAARCAEMHWAALCQHYGVTGIPMNRWLQETGLTPKTFTKPKRWHPTTQKALSAPGPDATTAGRAAHHLRRFYPNVFRASVADPKADKDLWYIGRGTVTSAELIAKAQAKGWAA